MRLTTARIWSALEQQWLCNFWRLQLCWGFTGGCIRAIAKSDTPVDAGWTGVASLVIFSRCAPGHRGGLETGAASRYISGDSASRARRSLRLPPSVIAEPHQVTWTRLMKTTIVQPCRVHDPSMCRHSADPLLEDVIGTSGSRSRRNQFDESAW